MFPFKFNCTDARDPFLQQLHSTFNATPVIPPSSRDIDLLFLISHRGQKTTSLGPLAEVLHPGVSPLSPSTVSSEIAQIAINKTSDFSLELGFQILPEVFKGFNLDMEPVKGAFEGGKELSFAFLNVRRVRVFPVTLGSALMHQRINTDHPSIKNILSKKGLYLVTSLIQSNEFSLTLNKTRNAEVNFEAAVQQLADANFTIDSNRSSDFSITHKGSEYLTFAFSCVELEVEKDGKMSINREVTWKKGEDEDGQATESQDPEISFMNPKLPAILAWDKN